jgi:hypothetical protein
MKPTLHPLSIRGQSEEVPYLSTTSHNGRWLNVPLPNVQRSRHSGAKVLLLALFLIFFQKMPFIVIWKTSARRRGVIISSHSCSSSLIRLLVSSSKKI